MVADGCFMGSYILLSKRLMAGKWRVDLGDVGEVEKECGLFFSFSKECLD
jgi:hypothetical protein